MNAEDIFHQALALPPAQRPEFLAAACAGNEPLQRRVEVLLQAHDNPEDFLAEHPRPPALTVDAPVNEHPGSVIGPYKLLELIGEGGMGAVWMAQQSEPIQRRVAVKIVKEGMDSRQVLARFEAERQALALMEHPNIAKVLDAGRSPSGRPYFVMELVKGQHITHYCDEKRLGVRERLELFGDVCRAVQHAHHKGIIHRDLKPSNVLVAPYDGKPVVKVIDFGVAKATGQPLTDKTLFTGFGALVGTPAYMSPEQAEVNNQDIDTRSDIYSLGVLLYELLTGTTPLTRKRLNEAALLEVLRLIREEDAPRLSTRLSSTEELASIAANRGMEPKKLSGLVRGELDWIAMKALEKDRNRRYETANGLAMDVQRYLHDEPVQACPPSALYRLRKFVRRNKVALATTTIAASALILGLAISIWQADRAHRAEAKQELQRILTQQQDSAARQSRYVARLIVASQAWQLHDIRTVLQHLSAEQPQSGQTDLRTVGWYYLWRRSHGDGLSFGGHSARVNWVAFSPDGKTLATASDDHTVKLWDTATGREFASRRGHTDMVNCVAFSPDGTMLASASDDRSVRIWDSATGKTRAILNGHKGNVVCVAFSPDGKMLASAGETIKIWDLSTGHEEATLIGHTNEINQVCYSPDGKLIASCSDDSTVRLWDLATGKERAVLRGHTGHVSTVAFAPKGGVLASAGSDHIVRLWDIASGQQPALLRAHTGAVRSVAFSPDGATLVSTGNDKTVAVWDVATRQKRSILSGHTDRVFSVAFSPSGTLLATAGQDTTAKLWSLPRGASPLVLRGHTAGAYSVAFSPDGKNLASGSWDKAVKLWDIGTGREQTIIGHTGGVFALAFSPDGKALAMAGDSEIWLWDLLTRQIRLKLRGHMNTIQRVAFSRDGSTLVSCGDDRTVRLWDTVAGTELATLRGHTAEVDCVAFSPDGSMLASSSRDSTVRLWDLNSRRELAVLEGHAGNVRTVTFSPDGKTLANGTGQSTILLWDVATRELRATLMGHTGYVQALVFSPDGSMLVSGSNDGTAKLWDLATGVAFDTLAEHTRAIDGIALAPDGKTLATASRDQTIRLWDITTAPN